MQHDPKPGQERQEQPPARTPNADMQAEDAGTTDSRADEDGGTAAESAMKQERKTDPQAGERR